LNSSCRLHRSSFAEAKVSQTSAVGFFPNFAAKTIPFLALTSASVSAPATAAATEALDELPADLVGDAGFDRFVIDHWQKLLAGETVHFHFLVPSRLDYLGFKVRHLGREQIGGRSAEVFRLALGGLLGLIVSGIDVAYEAESRILLRFEGLSNVRDPEGDNYVARIEFPLDARRVEPDASALEAARSVPLVSACAAPAS